MIISIDCRFATKSPTGIGKIFMDATRALITNIPDWKFLLISPHDLVETNLSDLLDRANVIYQCCPNKILKKDKIWYNTRFLYYSYKYHADLMWTGIPEEPIFPTPGIKRMILAHDVVALEYSKTQNSKGKWTGLLTFSSSIKNADYVWCNSHYTFGKVNQYFPSRKAKETVVGGSCSDFFKVLNLSIEEIKSIKESFGIKDKMLLFVGSLEPRKNLAFMLELMKSIYKERQDIQLLVVGGKGWKNSDIFNIVNSSDYPKDSTIFANYIDDDTLVKLYNLANCYISTSLNEGLGLPQIEAMKCGCPVVTAHNSAMIEVAENRCATISGWDPKVWISEIYKNMRDVPNPKFFDLRDYDWQQIAKNVKDYIERN